MTATQAAPPKPGASKEPARHGERITGLRRVHLVLENGSIFHEITHYLDKDKKEPFYTCHLSETPHRFETPRDWSHITITDDPAGFRNSKPFFRYADPPHVNGTEPVEIVEDSLTTGKTEIIHTGPWPEFEEEFGRLFDAGRNIRLRTIRDYLPAR